MFSACAEFPVAPLLRLFEPVSDKAATQVATKTSQQASARQG